MKAPAPIAEIWNRRSGWICVLLFVAVVAAYGPALGAGFIWDDAGHVTRPELRTLGGLGRIWFEPGATQQYYPVLHSAFWLEAHLWGEAAFGYHLLNVLLHAVGACLFAAVLRRLVIPGAWIAAFLFALHPVAVESVAWVAEQKNTLSTVLYLAAALAYLAYDRDRRSSQYATATLLFFLAVGTKTVAATLPAALLVVFWWKRGRLEARRDVVPLLPWFALGFAAGCVTSWTERTLIGASGAAFSLDLGQRGLLAGRAIWFYLAKLLWPANLMFIYPQWTIDPAVAWQYLFPLATLAVPIALWCARQRGALAAFLLFAGSLFPALGFVNVYPFIYSFVADHFQYLADLGAYALIAVAAATLLARWSRPAQYVAVAVVGIGLATLTWRQAQMYRDETILYQTTLAHNPGAWMAHNNLAILLVDHGQAAEAIPHYEAALQLRPNYPEGENNLGYALIVLNHTAEAIPHLERALRLKPDYAQAHNNLGIAFMNSGRSADGEKEFKAAMRLDPAYPEPYLNLGLALARAGKTAEAIAEFAEAARLRPDYGDAELNWAIGLTLMDRFAEAQMHFEKALALEPESAEAHATYGRALAGAGSLEEAAKQYRAAIELAPNNGDAHLGLAMTLRRLGAIEAATKEMATAQALGAGGAP